MADRNRVIHMLNHPPDAQIANLAHHLWQRAKIIAPGHHQRTRHFDHFPAANDFHIVEYMTPGHRWEFFGAIPHMHIEKRVDQQFGFIARPFQRVGREQYVPIADAIMV